MKYSCKMASNKSVRQRRYPAATALRSLAIAISSLLLLYGRAEGLVGGAPLATGEMARSVIGIIGPHDFFCTATAIASDLVLTAGHCMRPGPDYKVQYRDNAGSR